MRLAPLRSFGFTTTLACALGCGVTCGLARGGVEHAAFAHADEQASNIISDAKLAAMVRDMNAREWKTRDAARQELANELLGPLAQLELAQSSAVDRNRQIELADTIAAITLPNLRKLEAALQDTTLTPEQFEGISNIAFKLFVRGPRGAMGVSFAGSRNIENGVVIGNPVPGFDSMRVFQAGDSLRKIGATIITNDLEARVAIVSYDPGDSVEVEFIRAGEVRVDTVRLGDFAKLQNTTRPLDENTMRRSWRLRVDRLRKQQQASITVPASPARYNAALQAERIEASRARMEQSPTLQVVVTPLNVDEGGSQRSITTRPEDDFMLATDDKTNPNRQAIAELTRQIGQYEGAIKQLETQLRDQNLNPFQRADMKRRVEQFQQSINGMKDERRKIRVKGVEALGEETSAATDPLDKAKPNK